MTAPTYHTLPVTRQARVGIIGDPATASQAWLILHGYGMLAQGILHWFRHAARPGRVLIAPEGLSRFYAEDRGIRRVGASWMTREDREHEIEDIDSYLDAVCRQFVPGSATLDVHGFSQGVSAGARWLARHPRPVRRFICWAGAFPEDVAPVQMIGAVTDPIHFVVGDRDQRVPPEKVAADAERLRQGGIAVQEHRFAGGHRVDDGIIDALEP